MVVDIDLRSTPATIDLVEPDDFTAFKLLVRNAGAERGDLAHAVKRIGRMTADGHVFVAVEALHALAPHRAGDADWRRSFDGMLEYARARGWSDDAGAIRAHVQWIA